jgi:hypothetical protein
MSMKNKIKKRLEKINSFLISKNKPGLKVIHTLRLEVKHLEAFLELMILQDNFGAQLDIPERLEKLFHETGKLRKFGLEIKAIESIVDHNRLTKPILFLQRLRLSKKKSTKKLHKRKETYLKFKAVDFARYPGVRLSSDTWQKFLAMRASSILDLLKQDILADIRSLHQLRKILKSILYVMPVCRKGVKPVRVFLKTRKRFLLSVESKIGSIHDTGFFVTRLEKKQNLIQAGEETALKKIKREWQHDMVIVRKDLKPLLPAVRQFALDLKDQSTNDRSQLRAGFQKENY